MIRHTISLLFILAFLTACDLTLAADITPPPGSMLPAQSESPEIAANGPLYPLFPADPKAGEPIYIEKCAPCHGPEGKGDGSLADRLPKEVPAIGDASLARQSRPSDWYRIVTQGRMENQMPPFASLTDQERWNVVAYVFTLTTSQERLDKGRELYAINCSSCHGEDGGKSPVEKAGPGSDQEDAQTQSPTNFTDLEWIANRSANDMYQVISLGLGEAMPAFQDRLSDAERWMLTEYLRSVSLNHSDSITAEAPQAATLETGETQDGTDPEVKSLTSELVQAEQLRTITGSVNNLPGEVKPTGLEILLHSFDGNQLVMTQTVTLDGDGLYKVENIPYVPHRTYLAVVEFDGVSYSSNLAIFEDGQNSLDLPISVFESTTDSSQLVIERLHLFLEPLENEKMRVIALYIISNLGDKVVVSDMNADSTVIKPALTFPLPENATQLEFRDGELGGRFIPTEDGFGDLAPVKPGTGSHQILLAYELPLTKKLNFQQKMDLPVKALVALIPEDGLRVEGENLQDVGTREVDGFLYHTYNGAGIDAGDTLDLTINNASQISITSLSAGSSAGLIIGSIALVGAIFMAGRLFYKYSRKEKPQPARQETREIAPQEPETVEYVMDAILALDDLYKAGQLPEEAYLKRRKELKDRLRQLS